MRHKTIITNSQKKSQLKVVVLYRLSPLLHIFLCISRSRQKTGEIFYMNVL